MTDEKTSRVAMLWPESLKEQVREKVGGRGLTAFAIEAVQAKLGNHDAHQADAKELNEVKDLAQRLADSIAMDGDYEDPEETLRYIGLPSWIQTVGWPHFLARLVKPEDGESEPVNFDLEDLPPVAPPAKRLRRVDDVELPAIGDPDTIRSEPPQTSQVVSLLDRVRAKALEKGVDLSGVDLKPASTIEQPANEGESAEDKHSPAEMEAEPSHPDEAVYSASPEVARAAGACPHGYVTEGSLVCPHCAFRSTEGKVSEPEPGTSSELQAEPELGEPDPDACPKCGSELVGSECWECM